MNDKMLPDKSNEHPGPGMYDAKIIREKTP